MACYTVLGISKKPKIVTCVICDEKMNDPNEQFHYDVMDYKGCMWSMDVHRRQSCFSQGSELLDEQANETKGMDHICVTATINGRKFEYCLESRLVNYEFTVDKVSWNESSVDTNSEFLESYRTENLVIFAMINSLKKTKAYGIPKLISRDDPEVPPGLLESEWYVKTLNDAEEKYKRGMRVRGNNETEAARILSQYAQDTMISI